MLHLVDTTKALDHIQASANFDGGYGTGPGAESHSGQVFTCVGALSILGRLDLVDRDKLGGWLSERQLPNGGLNGRPEKKEDVCYSWWVASSLAMIDRLHWIDRDKLASFILQCQVSATPLGQCTRLMPIGPGPRRYCRPPWRHGGCFPYGFWHCWPELDQASRRVGDRSRIVSATMKLFFLFCSYTLSNPNLAVCPNL